MSPKTDDHKPAIADKPILRQLAKTLPKRIWKALSDNFQWKLLALALAVLLWVGLILEDPSLTRERIFSDVPLTISNSDTLRLNGLIVIQGLEEDNALVRLKVDVPQQEYNDVTYSNYNPRVDLSKIEEAGEQTIKVSTTSTSTYGTVTDVSPAEISIVVDEYITNYRIPVQVSIQGEYPEGYYGTTPTTDVSIVTVSGPESIVSEIAKIVLEYDVSSLSARAATLQTALPLHYMDRDGNELDSTLLEPTSGGVLLRSIVLEQTLYPIKTITLNQTALTTGSPKTGYAVKSVTLSPNVIIAAGDETTLSTINTLFLEGTVDVSDHDALFTAEIKVVQPDNVVYMSTKTITLIIDIEPIQKSQTYENIPIVVTDIPNGMTAIAETANVAVTLTGPMLSLETMDSAKITAFVSADALTAGSFALPVELTISHSDAESFTYSISPESVTVTVTAK